MLQFRRRLAKLYFCHRIFHPKASQGRPAEFTQQVHICSRLYDSLILEEKDQADYKDTLKAESPLGGFDVHLVGPF